MEGRVDKAPGVLTLDEGYFQPLWESAAVFKFDFFLGFHDVLSLV